MKAVLTDRKFVRRRDYYDKLMAEPREGQRVIELYHEHSDEYGPTEISPDEAEALAAELLDAARRAQG